MEDWLFYLFGAIALIAALFVVLMKRVFYSALSLIICLCAIAGIYLLLEAPFIAAVQIIVYAGAIMVLVLFVIMLLDPFSGALPADKRKYLRYCALVLGAATLLLLVPLLRSYDPGGTPHDSVSATTATGSVSVLAETLFRDYLLPFEVTSVLILVAIIGVVVLAKRQT